MGLVQKSVRMQQNMFRDNIISYNDFFIECVGFILTAVRVVTSGDLDMIFFFTFTYLEQTYFWYVDRQVRKRKHHATRFKGLYVIFLIKFVLWAFENNSLKFYTGTK